MQRRRKELPLGAILLLVCLALAMNLGLSALIHGVISNAPDRPPRDSDRLMEISFLKGEEEDKEELKEALEAKEEKQIVENHRLEKEERPDNPRRISEFDNKVREETQAQNRRASESKAGRPGQKAPSQNPGQSQQPSPDQSQSSNPNPSSNPAPSEGPPRPSTNEVQDQNSPLPLHHPKGELSTSSPSGSSSQSGPKTPLGAQASREALRRAIGGPANMDHLEDVKEGAENVLNTESNRYASFFNRLRAAVYQHWSPAAVHGAVDPEGKIFGIKDRRTLLHIWLNPDGSLNRIKLETPSGAGHLDDEAIRAIRAAQPFINPPKGLIDPATGLIDFRFMFILDVNGKRNLFRYRSW